MKYFIIFLFLIFNVQIFSQWTEQSITPTPPKLNCVCANSIGFSTEGWIGGDSGTILYTSNFGINWYFRNNSIIGNNSVCVIHGFRKYYQITGKALCSANSQTTTYIYRTSDQGINWTIVYQQPNGRIKGIVMLDTMNGFAIGDPVGGRWTILRTNNGGLNFDSTGLYLAQNGSEISNYNSLFYAQSMYSSANYLIFGTNNSRLYRSTNNGSSWAAIVLPFQNIYAVSLTYNGFYFVGPRRCDIWGCACGNGADTTGTYGQSWGPRTLPGSGDIHSLYCDIGYYCYNKGSQIYSSTNFSSQFTLDYTSPNGGNYSQISLDAFDFEANCARSGWGVKDNGTVSKYYKQWSGINKIGSDIPKSFSLSQNYPNPFNPSTKIKFSIPNIPLSRGVPVYPDKGGEGRGVFTSLIICDILGREVATLVNEELKAGIYEVEWNASNYPSGVYFYKLETESFAEIRKMVLLK